MHASVTVLNICRIQLTPFLPASLIFSDFHSILWMWSVKVGTGNCMFFREIWVKYEVRAISLCF